METESFVPQTVEAIDWEKWIPGVRANLCFIVDGGRVLLIRKLRGLGAGKINGPGGKIEPGETALEAAIRETIEEIGVEPLDPVLCGELFFQFVDGLSIHCAVFRADAHTGVPVQTEEAVPFWFEFQKVPYAEMWADDITWLPHVLAGASFTGYYIFDNETMLDHRLVVRAS